MTINSRFNLKYFFSGPYLFLFCVTLFIRFPFFFRDYIDHDESTFILIGKTVTEGHLPYDFLWDLKPPLLFYFFGLVEYIFPHSLVAVRMAAVIIIFISAVVLMQIAKTMGIKNGFLMALSYIIFSSLFGSLQGMMSEHVAVFFFLPGLFLFLKNKTISNLLVSGIFFGCALLCKLNLAYALLALYVYYFISNIRSKAVLFPAKNILIPIIGITIPFILIALPYLIQNKLRLFVDSVFMATLEYGHTTKVSVLHKLSVSAWIILLGLIVSALALRIADKENKKLAGSFVAILAGIIFTFYSSGTVNGHYLIEVFPFIAILLFGFIINKDLKPGYLKYAVLVLLVCVESYIEYYRIFQQYSKNSTFYNGRAFTSVNELKRLNLDDKKIFFADHHIGYWFLNKYPLTKSVTHPSSLSRPAFFKHFGNTNTSLKELRCIMEEVDPEVVVSRKECLSFFKEDSEENLYFMSKMKNGFQIVYQNPAEKIFIWAKK